MIKALQAAPYYILGICSLSFVAFSSASMVVLLDIARERTIITLTIDAPLTYLASIDVSQI